MSIQVIKRCDLCGAEVFCFLSEKRHADRFFRVMCTYEAHTTDQGIEMCETCNEKMGRLMDAMIEDRTRKEELEIEGGSL
jgi:hypothetical protein